MTDLTDAMIGQRIRRARDLLGLSQEALALAVDKSQDAISAYEKGIRGIKAVELPKFAKALNKSIAYFYGDSDPIEELSALYDTLPERGQRMVLDYIYLVQREFERSEVKR